MAVINFPAQLGCLMLRDGYSLTPSVGSIRTEMENGWARQRQTTRHSIARITCQWEFTSVQYAVFDYFYLNVLKNGTLPFFSNLESSLGMRSVQARFVSDVPPKAQKSGEDWTVSAELEVRNRPQLTAAQWVLVGLGIDLNSLLAANDPSVYWQSFFLDSNILTDSSMASSSLNGNGYQAFSNGLILQWGTIQSNQQTVDVTFPVPFPNAAFIATPTLAEQNGGTFPTSVFASNLTKTGFRLVLGGYTSGTTITRFLAVGR